MNTSRSSPTQPTSKSQDSFFLDENSITNTQVQKDAPVIPSETKDLLQEALRVTKECNILRSEVAVLQSALEEYTLQLAQYERLLIDAQALLLDTRAHSSLQNRPKLSPFSFFQPSKPPNEWLLDSWCSNVSAKGFLASVEASAKEGKWQESLAKVSQLLAEPRITHANSVNARLFRAAIQRHCERPLQALEDALVALADASACHLYELAGKAQFIRGLCLFDLARFPDAAWCFALASHTPHYNERAEMWRVRTWARIQTLPDESAARLVSSDFSLLPDGKKPD